MENFGLIFGYHHPELGFDSELALCLCADGALMALTCVPRLRSRCWQSTAR